MRLDDFVRDFGDVCAATISVVTFVATVTVQQAVAQAVAAACAAAELLGLKETSITRGMIANLWRFKLIYGFLY